MERIRFGTKLPDHPLETTIKFARYAEKSGLDSIWMVDHLVDINVNPWGAYFTWGVLSAIAAETRKVTLGTAVSDPHRLHPAVLAQAVMTLDHLSNGRAILGLGAGEATNLDPYSIPWDHPISRLSETVRVLKMFWTGKPTSFDGDFFHIRNAFIKPKPIRSPHPPIWIAANSQRSMKITGQEADGWIPLACIHSPTAYAEKLKYIQTASEERGRSKESIEPAVFVHTAIDDDRDKAREMIEMPAKTMLLYWCPEVFKEYGFESSEFHLLKTVYTKETAEALVKKARELPTKAIEDRFIFGTPSDCVRGIKRYLEAGARHFILVFPVPQERIEQSLRLYIEHVIPEIR